MGKKIGIDLGTTNSLAAICENGRPVIIPNALGHNFTPSVVHIPLHGPVRIGHAALPGKVTDPRRTIYGAKHFIGRKYNEVFDLGERMPCGVSIGENHLALFDLGDETYLPQVVSALVLKSLKQSAETYLGELVYEAVVSVPAYFSSVQRKATMEAAELAGLHVARLVEEPVAAAMAWRRQNDRAQKLAVLDLGGGTFDVTMVEVMTAEREHEYEVLSVSGDGFLGGDDFDERLMQWLIETAEYDHDVALERDADTLGRFRDAANSARHTLSDRSFANVRVPYLRTTNGHSVNFESKVSRQLFDELCGDLFDRLRHPCEDAMRAAGVRCSDIDHLILVGGASRMPRVRTLAELTFGQVSRQLVNPFEAIALGAAIQAAVLDGECKDVLLLNVQPLTLGLEGADESMIKMIKRNSTIPTKATRAFGLAADGVTSAEIRVLEGDGASARENLCLGVLPLEGLQDTKEETIEVSLDIDANRVIEVKVLERSSGRRESKKIEADTDISPAQRETLRGVVESLWQRLS